MTFRLCCLALVLLPTAALAHVFAQPYSLPVPFSIYAYAGTGALLLSFLVIGLFSAAPSLGDLNVAPVAAGKHVVETRSCRSRASRLSAGQLVSLGLLALCIVTGWFGSQNAFVNFNMTFFWIVFVLGIPYCVALLGDFYAPLNPWKALTLWLERAVGIPFAARLRYPAQALGYAPALLLYMGFIWLELFGELTPRGLSTVLAGYTLVNLAGAYVFGRVAWFQYGEFFGVLLRLIGMMSPVTRLQASDDSVDEKRSAPAATNRRRFRPPFVGLLNEPTPHLSLVLFILFMLSSTAFDGLHSTLPWVSLYWKHLYPEIAPWFSPAAGQQFVLSTKIYYVWQWLSLLLSPLIYLALFAGFVRVAKAVTHSTVPTHELVLRFSMSLLPIAFVYHLTHYYTVFLVQAGQLVVLVSDPFGFGWNLFGTAHWKIEPVMLDVGTIWLTQVALIVAGHIVSVYLAHVEALRIFGKARLAALSQLPMLALMMLFTNLGLWILSLPLAGG